MKKIFTLITALAFSVLGYAQDGISHDFEFTDKDGNVVPHGSVLTLTDIHHDPDGIEDDYISSGLYVKNVSGSASDYVRVSGNITELGSGSFQICFPSACIYIAKTGLFNTQNGTKEPGSISDLQTEWFFKDYGECVVDMQLQIGTIDRMTRLFTKNADGPKVTLRFVNADPASISAASSARSAASARYALDGRRLSSAARGLSIVRMSDGSMRKVVVR